MNIWMNIYFQNSELDLYKQVYEKFIKGKRDQLPLTDKEGMQRVVDSDFVYMVDSLKFMLVYSNDCDLSMLPTAYSKIPSSFGLPKNSTLKPLLDYQ